MLTIYGRRTSSNVQAVMWAVAELGLEHERLDYGHTYGGVDTPEYRAMNPNGLVPTLRDGDLVIWESAAIVRFLGARYGSEAFWPEDPVRRAHVDQWAEWGKSTLQPAFTVPIFWSKIRIPAAERDEAALSAAITRFGQLVPILESQIGGGGFVVGDDLTVADIMVAHILYRYYTIDIPREEHPVLDAYYARMCERPAFREHVMVSYEELRAEGA